MLLIYHEVIVMQEVIGMKSMVLKIAGGRAMAQWLRVLAAVAGDLGPFPAPA